MKKYIILAVLCCLCVSLNSQTSRYMLSNGMEVVITAGTASPLVKTELCIRGGFSSEERETAGFLDMNTRLFWTNRDGTAKSISEIGIADTASLFTSHAAIFSSSFPAFRSEEALALIRELVSTSFFDDFELDRIQSAYILEQKEFTDSVYGIIHSLVMEHLYPQNPWQQTQQMSYCYFQEVKKEKMRAILTNIRNKYYQPDNICLFISAPFTEEQILTLAKKHFESWQGKTAYTDTADTLITQDNKKTVFVSDGLPPALEQYIAVYPASSSGTKAESDAAADILSFILNADDSPLKKDLVKQTELGVERGDYADISFEHHYGQSRMVYQAILQKTNTSPVEKTQRMISLLQNNVHYSDEALRQAYLYKDVFLEDNFSSDSSIPRITAWARRQEESQSVSPSSLYIQEISSQAPYVFLLLNTKDFEGEKKNLEKDGWTIVHEKDLRKKIDQHKKTQTPEYSIEKVDVSLIEVHTLLEEHKKQIHESITPNGIRVVVDPSEDTDRSTIIIRLAGGVLFGNPKKPLVEKVIIKHLETEIRSVLYEYRISGNIKKGFIITSTPGLTASTINIQCASTDINAVLEGAARAFAFVDIKPSQADELIGALVSTEKMASFDVSYQLYSAAIETIFTGTSYESALAHPDLDAGLYNFGEIQTALTRIFNAERFSLYVCTGADTEPLVVPAVETYFSYLKKTENMKQELIEPVFPSITRWKTLYRLFSTAVPAQEAGERPAKLIPTTNFLDPSHLYFRRPLDERQPVFDAVLIALARHMEQANDGETIEVFGSAEVFFDVHIPSLCGIRFSRVQSYTALQKMMEDALQNFESWLIDEKTIEKAKTAWINIMMNKTSTVDGKALVLSQGNTAYEGIMHQYDQYSRLEKSTQKEFRNVFEQLLQKQTSLWILSSDTNE